MSFTHIRDDHGSYQTSKKRNFTDDLIWWGSLRLTPINYNGNIVPNVWFNHSVYEYAAG